MPSSRRPPDARRQVFLNLSAQIEGQLRAAYDQKYHAGLATQSSLASKLDVNRSAIHHRLNGHTNMTIETIADMVWALDHAIKIEIFDPHTAHGLNYSIQTNQPAHALPAANAGSSIVASTSASPLIERIINAAPRLSITPTVTP